MNRAFIIAVLVVCAGCTSMPERGTGGLAPQPGVDEACGRHIAAVHGTDSTAMGFTLDREIEEYQELVEQTLTYRAKSIETAQRLKAKIKLDIPFTGEELHAMNAGVVAHLELREKLYRMAEAHECWIDAPKQSLERMGITPEIRLKGIMASLSAALLLYDNYLLAISLFEEEGKLRRHLNHPDSGYDIRGQELNRVTAEYTSARNRSRVRAAIRYYEEEVARIPPSFREDPYAQYLELLISQSPSYTSTRSLSPVSYIWKKIDFLGAVTGDGLSELGKEGMNLFSMLFGNAVGLVETRKGKLYGRTEVAEELKKTLRAGDILLEKTPFRLTDKLIPGFWGHAAIWVGTEQELIDLGVWDHPVVAKYHDEIRQGRLVVEALRNGVEMNTLERFLNIDDMGIIRKADAGAQERGETIVLALRQVGKSYDFNFDVETTDKIVCSELVYLVYPGIDWPTAKALGRATFSPDHVALKALGGSPLQLVAFYHDGRLVERDPSRQVEMLMEGKRDKRHPGR